MHCQTCGQDLSTTEYIKVERGDFAVDLFCDAVCLQAHLEFCAPLTDAKSAAQNERPSPQPVVVEHSDLDQQPGESDRDYLNRLLQRLDFKAWRLR